MLRPLARVLMTLVQDDDVVDHRYNSYIEDAGENVAELEDDIAAALSDIERLAEESELYFQRSRELCGNQPVRRMRRDGNAP